MPARSIPASQVLRVAGVDVRRVTEILPRVDPDRVPVRVAPRWFRAFWAKGIVAVALPWSVYVEPSTFGRMGIPGNAAAGRLMAHELTHMEQWRRLGPRRHLVRYIGDYLRGRFSGLGHNEAYLGIGLEEEARWTAGLIVGDLQ